MEEQPFDPFGRLYSIRMHPEVAEEFTRRMIELGDEFAANGDEEGERFGFAGAIYRIATPRGQS